MVSPILNEEADAVAGGVELAEEVCEDWMTPHHRSLLASTEQIDPTQPGRIVGANMAISREVFDKIPGFDPELGPGQLGLGGETLLVLQMREAGFRIETAFDVAVEHCPDTTRLTWGGWDEAARKAGRAGAYRSYHWKHRHYSFPALLAGWMYYTLRVWWREPIVGSRNRSQRGMDMEEFLLRRKKYRIRQHLREYGKEPKYDERGLVKRTK
jgi:GT2 family glycosyltransferase